MPGNVPQQPIDPQPNLIPLRHRLDMHIRRAAIHRLAQDGVDDRARVGVRLAIVAVAFHGRR
jgi:hypothetical protein